MKKYRKLIIVAIILFAGAAAYAQGPGLPDEPEDTPIDGGVTLILAAAAGYGAKKISYRKRNK